MGVEKRVCRSGREFRFVFVVVGFKVGEVLLVFFLVVFLKDLIILNLVFWFVKSLGLLKVFDKRSLFRGCWSLSR